MLSQRSMDSGLRRSDGTPVAPQNCALTPVMA